jgi:hypothetical protein
MVQSNVFVGPVEAFSRARHAEWGSLLVVLRNGQPQRIVPPGRRLWRGLGAPIIGDVQVAAVNDQTVEVTQTISELLTKGEEKYVVDQVTVSASIRLNHEDDYAALGTFVRAHGRSFADDLVKVTKSSLEQLVRDVFSAHTHAELHGNSVTALLQAAAGQGFGQGLMLVDAIEVVGRIAWSQAFLDVQAARHGTLVDLAQTARTEVVGVEQARADSKVLQEKAKSFAPLAQALGVPLTYFLDPQGHADQQQLRLVVLEKLLEPQNRVVFQRQPHLLEEFLTSIGVRGQVSPSSVARQLATLSPDPSATAVLTSHDAPVTTGLGDGGPTHASAAGVGGQPELDLTTDRKLTRLWKQEGGHIADLTGLGGAAAPDGAAVIAVGPVAPAVPAELVTALARFYGVQRVQVFSITAEDYDGLCGAWFRMAAPEMQQELTVRTKVAVRDGLDQLHVLVSGPPRAAAAAVQHVTDPDQPALEALERILPFAAGVVELDDQ